MILYVILSVNYASPTGLTFPRKHSLLKAFCNTVLKNFYDSSLTALNTIDQLLPYFWWPSPPLIVFYFITLFLQLTPLFTIPLYLGFSTHFCQEVMKEKKKKKELRLGNLLDTYNIFFWCVENFLEPCEKSFHSKNWFFREISISKKPDFLSENFFSQDSRKFSTHQKHML